jgi:hypothetical protein
MLYNPIKLDISRKQDDKLKLAISRGNAVSIKVMIRDEGDGGEHTVLLTRGQIAKIERARLIGKRHISIRLSRKQVQANIKYEGGFLGMLAALAARALPTLLTGLAAGLVSGAVEKAVGGSGLYLQKKGQCANVQFVKGGGLYLTPHHPPQQAEGEGLYLRHGDAVYGEGLLLGPNSPFKNIPILGLIL